MGRALMGGGLGFSVRGAVGDVGRLRALVQRGGSPEPRGQAAKGGRADVYTEPRSGSQSMHTKNTHRHSKTKLENKAGNTLGHSWNGGSL